MKRTLGIILLPLVAMGALWHWPSGQTEERAPLLNSRSGNIPLREGEILVWAPNPQDGTPAAPPPGVVTRTPPRTRTTRQIPPQAYSQPTPGQRMFQRTRALAPLAKPLRPPRTGNRQPPAGGQEQSYMQFVNSTRRAGGRLVILPIGDLALDHRRALGHLVDALSAFYGLPAQCATAIPLSSLPRQCFRESGGVRQINADALLTRVVRPRLNSDIATIIAVTEFDLYPGDGGPVESTYGWSAFNQGMSVLSTFGILDNSPANRGNNLLRLTKLITHESAHTFDLRDCASFNCLMNVSGGPRESDSTPFALCPDCLAKLSYATGRDPALFLEDMLGLCRAKGFSGEARYYRRALDLMR